jgi:hypothetical protein
MLRSTSPEDHRTKQVMQPMVDQTLQAMDVLHQPLFTINHQCYNGENQSVTHDYERLFCKLSKYPRLRYSIDAAQLGIDPS